MVGLASNKRLRVTALVAYGAAVLGGMIFWRAFWSPDLIFLALLVWFVMLGSGKRFLRDFAPFVILLISYDAFRGYADVLNQHVHFTEMISFDTWLGGGRLPTAWLQQLLYHGSLSWYDYYFYSLYILHWVVPLGFGAFIWLRHRKLYPQFITAFVILSYFGFLTFVLFPAAPPWMASQNHVIPQLTQLSGVIWASFGIHNFPTIYSQINPNPVAAVPSLHVAYPVLTFLFAVKLYGRRALAVAIYPISVALGVVYFGEHYLFDVLVGVAYAGVVYAVTIKAFAYFRARQRLQRAALVPKPSLVIE